MVVWDWWDVSSDLTGRGFLTEVMKCSKIDCGDGAHSFGYTKTY